MSQPSRDKVGATPAKLALIGVLALVLAAVIVSNWPESAPPAMAAASAATPEVAVAAPESTAAEQASSPFGQFADDADWPERPIKEVIAHDPFAVAAWAIPPEGLGEDKKTTEKRIQELLHAESAIIFMSGDKRVARIGGQEFQVGDVIGGFKISDISSRGVVLSEAE
jgi:hypothetical protein